MNLKENKSEFLKSGVGSSNFEVGFGPSDQNPTNRTQDGMHKVSLIFVPEQIRQSESILKIWATLGDMNSEYCE